MCDFWETVLFRAGLYRGNALVVHRQLNVRHPLRANHFARWLALWEATVDEMYDGPFGVTGEGSGGQNRQFDCTVA